MRDDSTNRPSVERLNERLRPHGQEHLLRFWDEIHDAGRQQLASQIEAVDFARLAELVSQRDQAHDWAAMARRAEPPEAIAIADRTPSRTAEARQHGAAALRAGKIGVLLVAGGQGSRLGFDHPKGMFSIGPVSGASLLEIHFEKVLAAARRYGASVPVYMMTSPVTHAEQAAYLKEHRHFGLSVDDVTLFRQGTMPAVDAASGRALLAAKDSLFLSPDGHGGMVAALGASGALDDMRRRGIEHLFYLQVDNPLVPIADEELIGHHILADSDVTSMACRKQTPRDRVGNFALIDGRLHVIEYSDLADDVAELRDARGDLKFWAGSIAVHVFRVAFLEQMLGHTSAMPFHIAHKKVPHVNDIGDMVQPKQPNALKFERFIFDVLPHARNPVVVEYAEEDVFAPVKNAPGESRDTPQYVQRFMINQHRRWLEAAGTKVAPNVAVEISPLWALDAEGVAARADRPERIDQPVYLRDEGRTA